MTHHILLISNYLSSSIAEALRAMYKTIKSISASIQSGQQARAEYEVARMIHREYRNESFSHILYVVKDGRANELIK